jgi:large subunit ribosomal protein L15
VKLHDLRPAAGSRRARTRVGRGIAAGQGKTGGRGTKGQKARAGASIPAWFEGGQTPIHVRVPKLRGFKNRFKIEYAVVNVGQISAYAEAGRFGVELEGGAAKKGKKDDSAVMTVNAELLASAGLIGGTTRPVKVLGHGEVSQKLFVAADAFSASARKKIEDAGGFVQVLAPEREVKQPSKSSTKRAPATETESDEESSTASESEEPAAEAAPERAAESTQESAAEAAQESPAEAAQEPAAETADAEAPAKPRRRSTKTAADNGA